MNTIRLQIEGRWSAHDFSELFWSLSYLYLLMTSVEFERQEDSQVERAFSQEGLLDIRDELLRRNLLRRSGSARAWRNIVRNSLVPREALVYLVTRAVEERSTDLLNPEEQLQVTRCEYASPGGIDLAGLGQAIGHLKDFLCKLIDTRVQAPERELKNQLLAEERKSAALRNLREQIAVLKELGYTELEVRELLLASRPAVDVMLGLTGRGLITGVQDAGENDG